MNGRIEYHYAPLAGCIACVRNGEIERGGGWPAHHAMMAQFLELRASGQIELVKTVTFGHFLFHGHSGRVDVYVRTGATQ